VKAMRYDLIKFPYHSAAALFNSITWIQYGNTNATMRMRLAFSLLFSISCFRCIFLSLSLCFLSLFLLALWINCLCLFRANLRQRQRQWQRATTTFIDPVGKTKKACDIMFLTKVIAARFL